MSEEISSSSSASSSSLLSSSSKKRQNVDCDTAAGDFIDSVEAKPTLAEENGFKRRRWSGHINNNTNSTNNNFVDVSPSDTDCDDTVGAVEDGADALNMIGENQTSSSTTSSVVSSTACENTSSTPLTNVGEHSKVEDQGTFSSVFVLDTPEMSNMVESSAEAPLDESSASMAVTSSAQPMEANVDNDIVVVVGPDTSGSSAQNTSNTPSQRQLRIRQRRYRHSNTDAASTPSHEDANNESDNVQDGDAASSQHHSEDSDDSDGPADAPFIYNYDSESSDNSDQFHNLDLMFDPESEVDTEEDFATLDEEDEMNDALADDTPGGGGGRQNYVFGLADKVLSKSMSACNWNTTKEVILREHGMSNRFGDGRGVRLLSHNKFNDRFYASQFVVERMKLSHCLRRHNGCVNSLNFNRSGELLCSGSDDKRIVVWDWASNKFKHVFKSGHRENIFQTKFITSGAALDILSAGRDGQVRRAIIPSCGKAISTCLYKHRNAVHKLVVCPTSPFEILSVGEDGHIRHSDLRLSPNSLTLLKVVNNGDSRNGHNRVRLFSIAHHPYSPEVCVCGSDEYVRVYDKRKFEEPIYKMCPSHLTNMGVSQVTCCTYNYNGTEILATYSDEQIYLFDNIKYSPGSYVHVYRGHYNHRTIKGVNFFGPNSEYVISGSDCGNVFFWDKTTEAILNFMSADALGVVNCLEPHPSIPVLATSGLDYSVKVWTPGSERTSPNKDKIKACIRRNLWRSGLEGRDILDNALNDIILEAFHPDVFDSEDSLSVSSLIRYGHDATITSSSSSSSGSTNGTQSTENNDHQYNAHDSDVSSDNEGNTLNGYRCQTQ